MMEATTSDIGVCLKAANEFKDRMNGNPKVRQLLKRWNPLMHFDARDSAVRITFRMSEGMAVSAEEGHRGEADLSVTFPTAGNLVDMFMGRLDPTPMYLSGDILVRGHQADVIKLDAITMIIWPDK
jgi:hypothetical protein